MKRHALVLGAMLIAAVPVLAQEHDHAAPQAPAPQAQTLPRVSACSATVCRTR